MHFHTDNGVVRAVDGVSWDVRPGETLGIVGESGSGKSVSAMAIMGLVPSPPARFPSGRIIFRGEDLLTATDPRLRALRGKEVSMIFQDPLTALNPVFKVGSQIAEVIRVHESLSRSAAKARAVDLLGEVGIPNPSGRAKEYPHQFSGGMRQRAMIAMALALNPALLLADEPTTALDVTVQAQIMELLESLQEQRGTAIVLITHDLGLVASHADRVMVMYAGRVAEYADTERHLLPPSPCLHARPAVQPGAPGPAARRAARADPRFAAQPHPRAPGLRVPPALLVRDQGLPHGRPGSDGAGRLRPSRGLPPQRRGSGESRRHDRWQLPRRGTGRATVPTVQATPDDAPPPMPPPSGGSS